jgi:hypothetical protein
MPCVRIRWTRPISAALFFLLLSGAVFADMKTATFQNASGEFKWSLKDLNPDLPADWSAYQHLTLEL